MGMSSSDVAPKEAISARLRKSVQGTVNEQVTTRGRYVGCIRVRLSMTVTNKNL